VAAEAVDTRLLSIYVGQDPALQERFLRAFLREAGRCVDRIATSLVEDNLPEARAEAHKLKPSAIAVGAQRLAQLCLAIESSTYDGECPATVASQLREETVLVEAGIQRVLALR
jgi:HPt (histidine-containing phosphotransfer) domain-containing protein